MDDCGETGTCIWPANTDKTKVHTARCICEGKPRRAREKRAAAAAAAAAALPVLSHSSLSWGPPPEHLLGTYCTYLYVGGW